MNDREKHIYEVALVALSEKGYHGTSMRDIASAVGIQTPSLYNYFQGKQDLLYRIMRFVMEDLTAQTQDAVAAASDDPVSRLRAAIRAFVMFNTTHRNEAAVSDAGLSILAPRQREQIVELRDAFDEIYTHLIHAGQRESVLGECEPAIVKNAITSTCARVYLWYRPDGLYTPERVADTLSDYLIAGLLHASNTKEVIG